MFSLDLLSDLEYSPTSDFLLYRDKIHHSNRYNYYKLITQFSLLKIKYM